jgi:hypothetical protein
LIARKAIVDKLNVIAMWLVTVKLKGTIPHKLQKKIKQKILNNIGKYKEPFFLHFQIKHWKK